ncbi:MAG: TatD family hydrolase [Calditrichia bacterium]
MLHYTDTHAHLHFDNFQEDLTAVVERAEAAGIDRILTLGTETESSTSAVNIAEQFPRVFAAVGIHPTDIFKTATNRKEAIRELAIKSKKVKAIGEIGLDLYWKDVPLREQLPVLEEMIDLAEELQLPVVIHNRDAQAEMQDFFRAHGISRLRGVMHSFAGNETDVEFYLERELYISFTGVITFKNFKQQEVVRSIPLNRLLLETDCPFLAPVPKRGKRNEPAFVQYTAQKLAELLETSVDEVARKTFENSVQLFGW